MSIHPAVWLRVEWLECQPTPEETELQKAYARRLTESNQNVLGNIIGVGGRILSPSYMTACDSISESHLDMR